MASTLLATEAQLTPLVTAWYWERQKELPDWRSIFFGDRTATRRTETHQGVGEMGTMEEWETSGNQVAYDTVDDLWEVLFKMQKYSKGVSFSQDDADDDLHGILKDKVRGLATTAHNTFQLQCFDYFSHGHLGQWPGWRIPRIGGDGQPLFSKLHPRSPKDSRVQSNFDNLPLNSKNLDLVRQRMLDWQDDKDIPLLPNPTWLVTSKSLTTTANQLVASPRTPSDANNGMNPFYETLRVIEIPGVKDNFWAVIDPIRMKDSLLWYWRKKPGAPESSIDKQKDTIQWFIKGRWTSGWVTWTWISANRY